MCSGGGGGGETVRTEYIYQKADPAPTQASVSDVSHSASAERAAVEKERRKKGQRANMIATDRGTILGSIENAGGIANMIGQRPTLG